MPEESPAPTTAPTSTTTSSGMMKLISRNGEFSKTAFFAVVGNILVLANYALQSWLAGATYDLGFLKGAVPVFSSGDALSILSILNATYVGHAALTDRAPPSAE